MTRIGDRSEHKLGMVLPYFDGEPLTDGVQVITGSGRSGVILGDTVYVEGNAPLVHGLGEEQKEQSNG